MVLFAKNAKRRNPLVPREMNRYFHRNIVVKRIVESYSNLAAYKISLLLPWGYL